MFCTFENNTFLYWTGLLNKRLKDCPQVHVFYPFYIINILTTNELLTIQGLVNTDFQTVFITEIATILQIGDRTISIYNLHGFKYLTKYNFDKIQNPLWYSSVFHIHIYKVSKSQYILIFNGYLLSGSNTSWWIEQDSL